jgi:hypothetical protein
MKKRSEPQSLNPIDLYERGIASVAERLGVPGLLVVLALGSGTGVISDQHSAAGDTLGTAVVIVALIAAVVIYIVGRFLDTRLAKGQAEAALQVTETALGVVKSVLDVYAQAREGVLARDEVTALTRETIEPLLNVIFEGLREAGSASVKDNQTP